MSRQLMRDPVISVHGYTFERQAITNWILVLGNNFCPCSGKDMTLHDLVSARNFKEEINMWRAEHGLPSDKNIIGMTLTIPGDEECHQTNDIEEQNNELDHEEEGSLPDRNEDMDQEVECKQENKKDTSNAADDSGYRGKTPMVRPLFRLLRRKVLPFQPRISS